MAARGGHRAHRQRAMIERVATAIANHGERDGQWGRPVTVRRKGEREEDERDRGQKRHFTAVLSPPKPEINILIRLVSFSKFGTN